MADPRTDEQRRALLASIAESGSAGQAAYDRAQEELGQARQQAVTEAASRAGAINAPSEYLAQARTGAAAPYDMRQADLAQNRATFGADVARQQAGNEEYFGRLSSAIPATEARTKAAVEQIIREQEEAQRNREQEKQMQAAELADKGEQRAFDREMRQLALARAQAEATGRADGGSRGGRGGRGPSVGDQLRLQKADREQALQASRNFVLSNLQKSASKGTQQAFYEAVKGKTLGQALSLIGGAPDENLQAAGVDRNTLADWVRRYYEPTDEELGMALGLVPVPGPAKANVGPALLGAIGRRKLR